MLYQRFFNDRQRIVGGGFAIFLYVLLHSYTLGWYPFVHSDEVWLAWLSRGMTQGSWTEDFFTLTPRYPHGIKVLYHGFQGLFLTIQWSVLAARFPSLLAGLAVLFFWYRGIRNLTPSPGVAVWATAFLAFDPWFFSLSHFGRQEITILLTLTLGFWILSLSRPSFLARAAGAGFAVGLGVFIHPNSFISALALVPWLFREQQNTLKALLVYGGVLALSALGVIGLSFRLDPQFLVHYLALGGEMGIDPGLFPRLIGFRDFFVKLWGQIQGTYYLPPSRFVLILGLIGVFGAGYRRWPAHLSFGAVAFGIFVIGKFSPLSFVFFVPWIYFLGAEVIGRFAGSRALVLGFLVFGLVGGQLGGELIRWYPGEDDSYNDYLHRIQNLVGPEGRVLANLNTGFAFEPDRLRVWRDFDSLPERTEETENLNLEERPVFSFLVENDVRWVVLPLDEFDRIYYERPLWNEVYGNPYRFYPDIREVLDRYGTLVGEFISPNYGVRVLPFRGTVEGRVRVYRLSGLGR